MNEGEPHPHPTNEHSIGSSALLRDLLRSSSRRGYVSFLSLFFALFALISLVFLSQRLYELHYLSGIRKFI